VNDKERNKKFSKERAKIIKGKTAIQRDTLAEIERLLKLAGTQISATLAATPTDYQAWNLPQLQNAVNTAMSDIGQLSAQEVSGASNKIWQQGIDLIDKPVAAAGLEIAAVLPAIDTRQLIAMRTFMTGRMTDISMTIANSVNSELGLVAIGAKSQQDAINNITGFLKSGRSRAITVLRTELGGAFSVATQQRMTQAAEILPGLKKQWRRSGKIHSRQSHDAADGQIVDQDKPFRLSAKVGTATATGAVVLMFPRDPAAPVGERVNCGCESLPFMDDWEVKNPKRMPFTDEELKNNSFKRALNEEAKKLDSRKNIKTITTPSGKKIKASVIDYNGTEIVVPTDLNTDYQRIKVDDLKRYIDQVPEKHRGQLKEIRLFDEHFTDGVKVNKKSVATFDVDNKFIEMYRNDRFEADALDKIIGDTVRHETGHVVESNLGAEFLKDWKKAIKADGDYVTDYARTDIHEDVAETMMYHWSGDRMDRRVIEMFFPERFKLLKKYKIEAGS